MIEIVGSFRDCLSDGAACAQVEVFHRDVSGSLAVWLSESVTGWFHGSARATIVWLE